MSAQPTLPLHATPKLHIYDPSGQPIHQPEVPKITINKEKEKKKEESPPMFKCGDRLCIFTGDDYYHLPKEMDISHWEGDLGDLYNFKQLPYGDWPAKIPDEYLNIPEPVQTDVEMSDSGDFEPMELFKHYHELSPNPKEKTFLETIADADEDGDDMMEFLETQVSTTHTALSDSDLESDSPNLSTPSIGTLSLAASSESNSLIAHSETESHPLLSRSNASATSKSMISYHSEKRRRSRSQTLSQSYSDNPSSSRIEAALSQALDSESQGSAGDVSSSSSSIASTAGAHLSHTDSNVTNQSSNSGHGVATVDEKIDDSTHSTQTESETSLSSLRHFTKRYRASTIEAGSIQTQSASSQESLSSSHSTHHSTSTDEPGVVTPELHPSRLDVTVEDSDDPSSTPPLSPDNEISMMADTTIGTIKSDEDVFYNGDLVSEDAMEFSMAKTDSEEEEDSDDEDRPLIPRLLFNQMAHLASIKQKSPKHQIQARQPIKATGQASDFLSPAVEVKLPKTPQRSRKSDQSRQRGRTAPAPLLSAFKMAPGYEPPKHRQRPFFPNQTSDTRRAGTEEPSPSTIFPERHTFQSHPSHDATPSRPLFLLANAAVDAADGPGDGDDTWPRSGTVMDLGDQSREVANASLASVGIANDNLNPQVHRSSLTSAPSPSEPIWQKGHVNKIKANKASTSAKGRRGFVPPAPKGQCPAAPENIRTVLPLAPAGIATPAAKQTSNLKRSRETPLGRQPLVPAQSTDSIATYVESPQAKQKSRVQMSSVPKIWSPPVGCVKTVQRNNSAGLKPNRRFGYTPSKVLQEDTVKLRQVRDERSPSPSPEAETLDSSVPMEVDPPNESQGTVSSADSGLMGRPIARSLSPPPPLVTAPGRGKGRGRGGGRPRGRGRGRGMTRASTSAGRQSSVKPDNSGTKRKPGDEDVSEVPAKKVKATRGRSKSVSDPSRKAYSPVKEAGPVQEIAPTEVAPPIENVPSVERAAPIGPAGPMEDVLTTEVVVPIEEASPVDDSIVNTIESVPGPEPIVASVLPAQTQYSASTSTRSSVQLTPTSEPGLDPEPESEVNIAGTESPDPIALAPGDDLEIKQEALDDHHAKVKPGKGKGRGGGHPRQYSTEELVIILNTLGPDKRLWDRSSKSKLEEICENLSKAGYMERTPAAMRFKVKELFNDEK